MEEEKEEENGDGSIEGGAAPAAALPAVLVAPASANKSQTATANLEAVGTCSAAEVTSVANGLDSAAGAVGGVPSAAPPKHVSDTPGKDGGRFHLGEKVLVRRSNGEWSAATVESYDETVRAYMVILGDGSKKKVTENYIRAVAEETVQPQISPQIPVAQEPQMKGRLDPYTGKENPKVDPDENVQFL